MRRSRTTTLTRLPCRCLLHCIFTCSQGLPAKQVHPSLAPPPTTRQTSLHLTPHPTPAPRSYVLETLINAAQEDELLPSAAPQQLLLYSPQELAKQAAKELGSGSGGWVADLLAADGRLADRALPCAAPRQAAEGIERLTTEVSGRPGGNPGRLRLRLRLPPATAPRGACGPKAR